MIKKQEIERQEPELDGIDIYIGKRLKLRRIILKMSQDSLAALIGVTFQQVQKYETGENRLSASRLFTFANILAVNVAFFFEGIDIPKSYYLPIEGQEFNIAEEPKIFDPMQDTETLQLVGAYWKIQDSDKRKKLLELIESVAVVDNGDPPAA
jgi:transcriptional regulator with XRE-family HTH domain